MTAVFINSLKKNAASLNLNIFMKHVKMKVNLGRKKTTTMLDAVLLVWKHQIRKITMNLFLISHCTLTIIKVFLNQSELSITIMMMMLMIVVSIKKTVRLIVQIISKNTVKIYFNSEKIDNMN